MLDQHMDVALAFHGIEAVKHIAEVLTQIIFNKGA
ncbi:yfcI domain protein (plasmid) [Yersinia pestis 14735]|nr:yfcI domain protein [Yersinia pestis 14735]